METSAKAMLVGTPEDAGERSDDVAITISREEIEEALASDAPLDLILEVARPSASEVREVSVSWRREDLETLLAREGSDSIRLTFDRSELDRAVDEADFEGHGIREMVLLTVAAASSSAAFAVSTASGQLIEGTGGGAPSSLVAPASHDEAGLASRGIEAGTLAATHDEATLAARGIEAVAPAGHDEATLAARGIDAGTLAASRDEATLAARGIGIAPVSGADEAGLTARGIDPQPLAATHDEATLAARGIEEPVVVDSGTGFELPSVEPGTAAAVGGLAGAGLLIVAASFLARRGRVGTA